MLSSALLRSKFHETLLLCGGPCPLYTLPVAPTGGVHGSVSGRCCCVLEVSSTAISGPALVHVARSSYRSARLSICTLRWKFQPPIGGPALCTRGCRARLRTLRPLYTLPVAPAANPKNYLKRSFFAFRCFFHRFFALRTKPNPKKQAKPILRVVRRSSKQYEALNGSIFAFRCFLYRFLYYERSQTPKNQAKPILRVVRRSSKQYPCSCNGLERLNFRISAFFLWLFVLRTKPNPKKPSQTNFESGATVLKVISMLM